MTELPCSIFGLPRWLSGKESACSCISHKRLGFNSSSIPGEEDPLEKWQLTPVFLLRKPHGQTSLAGYSPSGLERVRHFLATKQQQQCSIFSYYILYLFVSEK